MTPRRGRPGTVPCLDCLQVKLLSGLGVIFKSLVLDMVSVLLHTRKEQYFNIDVLPKRIYMAIAILEPVFAGIMVSLINKYVLSGSCSGWLQNSCTPEQVREDEHEVVEDDEGESSTNTTISDADVHVHCQ